MKQDVRAENTWGVVSGGLSGKTVLEPGGQVGVGGVFQEEGTASTESSRGGRSLDGSVKYLQVPGLSLSTCQLLLLTIPDDLED